MTPSSHYLYVITHDGVPVAVRWDLVPAIGSVPGSELATTHLRKIDSRSWEFEFPDGTERPRTLITRVDTAPFTPREM